jgi:hypothetical protein
MKDLLFVAITIAFFLVTGLFVRACDKLSRGK